MKKNIVIIGAGPCALMLGCCLDTKKFNVSVYEKNSSPGRKLLVAGDGGLNLTHSEPASDFITRYSPRGFLEKAFMTFNNADFIRWLNNNGIETYVGSSKRVFPLKGTKPITVLKILLDKMRTNGVHLFLKQEWKGFKNDNLVFENEGSFKEIKSDIVIFCMGGASWPVTGSTGSWLPFFKEKGIRTIPFQSSNCAFKVDWDKNFISRFEGFVLKNIVSGCSGKTHAGEIVLTLFGLEGSGIYPLSPQIRKQLHEKGMATVFIDLKPQLDIESILKKLGNGKDLTSDLRKKLNLSEVQVGLLKQFIPKSEFVDVNILASHIKKFQINITGLGPIEDAISTVGGISLDEITESFELKKLPGHYCIGEMLDYDAPTGGYLLQSCFSMAAYLSGLLNK